VESTGSRPRRGRPPKGGEGKRASFNTRIRDSLKQRLEAAAANAGRSLSEEIEFRLERSMDDKPLFDALQLVYGPHVAGFLLLMGEVVRATDAMSGPWERLLHAFVNRALETEDELDAAGKYMKELDESRQGYRDEVFADASSFQHMRCAIELLLDAIAPEGKAVKIPPVLDIPPFLHEWIMDIGRHIARGYCEVLVDAEKKRPYGSPSAFRDQLLPLIRELLGEDLLSRIRSSQVIRDAKRREDEERRYREQRPPAETGPK
jgi:hypothetical protein